MNKEQWVNKVMESTGGIRPAMPPGDLYEKINRRITYPDNAARTITLPVKRWAAAAILFLTINIGSCIYAMEQNRTKTIATASSTLAKEIQASSTYNY